MKNKLCGNLVSRPFSDFKMAGVETPGQGCILSRDTMKLRFRWLFPAVDSRINFYMASESETVVHAKQEHFIKFLGCWSFLAAFGSLRPSRHFERGEALGMRLALGLMKGHHFRPKPRIQRW